jgi:cytoskeletal protein CcmA (bactofilin family)
MATYVRQSSFSDGDTITAALFNNEFNQLVNAFNVSTGHTHDGSTTGDGGPISNLFSNALVFGTNANTDIAITFNATTNDGVLTWMEDEDYFQFSDDLLIATTEKIQFRDTAIYINSSADGQLDLVADTEIQIAATTIDINGAADISGNLAVGGNLTVTGTTTFNGGTITMGDAATDNVVFGADVDSNIIPDDDNTYDLGSSSQEWKDLYVDGIAYLDGINFNGTAITSTAAELNILDGVTSTAAELNILDGVTSTAAELNILDGVTSTAAELNILDGVTSTAAELNILDGVTASATDINLIDGITNGTVIASKAIITDSNKDITGGRNITISGELDAATLDISGDADIDGTLEADAITIAGVTLAETISDTVGAMVGSNTETGISVTYDDSDNTLDFVIGADSIVSSMIDTNIDIAGTLDVTGVLTADTNATIAGTLGIAGGSTNGVAISQGAIAIKNGGTQSYIDFYCESSNAHYARLQSAAHSAYSGNITLTLPSSTGTLALTSSDITGTAALATASTITANNSTDENIFPVFVDGATGTQGLETDTGFTYNPSSGNLTIGGQLAAATLDISGDVDVDGTLEADAITVNGTTLAETISDTVGAMVSSNTETGIAVTYDDSDNTLDFVIGADVIVNSMIADDAIDSAQIADGSIDTAHIADDQVTGAKLSNDVTIANDLTVSGNLVVTGSTTQTGSIVSNSNFQSLANNNSGNATDFGLFGKYVESSTTKYAGLFFDASTDNTFRLFVDTQTEPSTTVNTGATGYAAGTLIAGEVSMTTLDIGGTDVTATAAELNFSDGVTSNIQTQLDTKATTGKAIAMALVFG